METEDGLDVQCVPYDEQFLINGRRKHAPRLTVLVKKAVFVIIQGENRIDLIMRGEEGEDYLVCQVWYYLCKVTSTEKRSRGLLLRPRHEG